MANAFRALVQGLVKQAITIVGDLAEPVTYTVNADPVYDPVSGEASATSTTYNFNAVFARFNANNADAQIVISTDAKLTVAFLDLPIRPRENDAVSVKELNWTVRRVLESPGDAVWSIHIREV